MSLDFRTAHGSASVRIQPPDGEAHMSRPPLPPFTLDSAIQKVRMAERDQHIGVLEAELARLRNVADQTSLGAPSQTSPRS